MTDTYTGILDAIEDTPEQAANMRTRSDLAWSIVDTIKEKGWTADEAAKLSGIDAGRMYMLLVERKMVGFSDEELVKIAGALQAKKQFIYLHEVNKNLDLLYQYKNAVGSARAFGETDQDCINLIGGYFKRDYGDELTLQAVNELGIFYLAAMMLKFLNSGKEHLINRVLENRFFCSDVIRVFYTLSKIPSAEVVEAEKEADKRNKKNAETVEKVRSGHTKTKKFTDKQILIAYFREKNYVVLNVYEIDHWPFDDWPLTKTYEVATYKKWYKEAMPNVTLKSGKPRKQ